MKLIIRLVTTGLAVFVASAFLPGVHVNGLVAAVLVGGVLTVLNATLKPLLILFTLPATIMTLGLFLFIINALIIVAADAILTGFAVDNFLWALLFSLVLSIVSSVFNSIEKKV